MTAKHGSNPIIHHSQSSQEIVDAMMAALAKILPFSDAYGGLDFTKSAVKVGVNIEVIHGDKFLALERSTANGSHAGKFNNVAGYMLGNGTTDILETVYGELFEEIGLVPPFNGTVRIGKVLTADRKDIELHIVAVQVELHDPHDVVLNNEHTDSRWVTWGEYVLLDTVPVIHGVRHHFAQLEIETIGQPLGLAIKPIVI